MVGAVVVVVLIVFNIFEGVMVVIFGIVVVIGVGVFFLVFVGEVDLEDVL